MSSSLANMFASYLWKYAYFYEFRFAALEKFKCPTISQNQAGRDGPARPAARVDSGTVSPGIDLYNEPVLSGRIISWADGLAKL